MARRAQCIFPLEDGRSVGASFKVRKGYFRVQFPHPTVPGKYVEAATGVEVPPKFNPKKQKPPPDAFNEASKIIARHYRPTLVPDLKKTTWDEAIDHLKRTPDLRPDSIRAYQCAIGAVRLVLDTGGPGDITERLANQFKRDFLAGTYKRSDASDAASYSRSPTTCNTYLRAMRSLWNKHLKSAGFVTGNPWKEVAYANAPKPKRVRLPQEDAVQALLGWLGVRHTGWDTPRLFIETKLVAGCRTLDLCKVKSEDLDGTTLTITAQASKTREARSVPLPPVLAAKLHLIKGPTWLWECTVAESKEHRPATRTHAQTEYQPGTWRWTVQNLFREFNAGRAKKDKVRPHDLRARAITPGKTHFK